MPERERSEYSEEDLKHIDEYVNSGINATQREPFKLRYMFALVAATIIGLGGISLLIGYLVEPYL